MYNEDNESTSSTPTKTAAKPKTFVEKVQIENVPRKSNKKRKPNKKSSKCEVSSSQEDEEIESVSTYHKSDAEDPNVNDDYDDDGNDIEDGSYNTIVIRNHKDLEKISEANSYDNSKKSSSSSKSVKLKKKLNKTKVKNGKKLKKTKDDTSDNPDDIISDDNIIGIIIHCIDGISFNKVLQSPRIKISIYDLKLKEFLRKSDTKRSAVNLNEPDDLDYIQPIISKAGNLINSRSLKLEWNELILINEEFQHIENENVIIFFEFIDLLSKPKKEFTTINNRNGWHYICWAFLRPFPKKAYTNLEHRIKLQFYKYSAKFKNSKEKLDDFTILKLFQLDERIKYSGCLEVTIKPIKSSHEMDLSFIIRPQNMFEEKNLADYLKTRETFKDKTVELMGKQICNNINKKIVESIGGCLISRFSKSGDYFAYAPIDQNFSIKIFQFPSFNCSQILYGHTGLINDIVWKCTDYDTKKSIQYLISSSSDKTVIIWIIYADKYLYSVLPHPAFVYRAKFFLIDDSKKFYVITGGRDAVLRIWKSKEDKSFQLIENLDNHEGYITGIVCHKNKENIYTTDAKGFLIEWLLIFEGTEINCNLMRKIQFNFGIISSISIHPHGQKVLMNFFNGKENMLKIIDAETFYVIRSIPETTSNYPLQFTISHCGTFIFISTEDNQIQIINLINGLKPEKILDTNFKMTSENFISFLDIHPTESILCSSIYGPNGGLSFIEYTFKYKFNLDQTMNLDHLRRAENKLKYEYPKFFSKQNKFAYLIMKIDAMLLNSVNDDEKSFSYSEANIDDKSLTYCIEDKKIKGDKIIKEENEEVEEIEEDENEKELIDDNENTSISTASNFDRSYTIKVHTPKSNSDGNRTYSIEKPNNDNNSYSSDDVDSFKTFVIDNK